MLFQKYDRWLPHQLISTKCSRQPNDNLHAGYQLLAVDNDHFQPVHAGLRILRYFLLVEQVIAQRKRFLRNSNTSKIYRAHQIQRTTTYTGQHVAHLRSRLVHLRQIRAVGHVIHDVFDVEIVDLRADRLGLLVERPLAVRSSGLGGEVHASARFQALVVGR